MSLLSPAQIQERRNAARARWDRAKQTGVVAAGAGLGAAAGAALAQPVIRALDTRNQAAQGLTAAANQHAALQAFINRRARRAKSQISDSNFLTGAPKLYETKARIARTFNRALLRHQDEHSEPFFDSTSGEGGWASDDPEGEQRLAGRALAVGADQAERYAATAADIRAKGKAPQVKQRKGSIHIPKTEQHTRKIKGALKLTLSTTTRQRLEDMFAADSAGGDELSHLHDLGIRSIDDLEAHFRRLSPQDRQHFATYLRDEVGLPKLKLSPERKTTEARTGVKVIPAHTVTTQGYPSAKDRLAMRTELLGDIKARHTYRTNLAASQNKAAAAPLRATIDAVDASLPGRALRFLPGNRRGILAAGVAGGALIGAGLAGGAEWWRRNSNPPSHPHPLAKANPGFFGGGDPDSSPPPAGGEDPQNDINPSKNAIMPRKSRSTPRRLLNAADNIEHDLAAGVGRALASWKDSVTPENVAQPDAQGGLFNQLDGPLFAGMHRLDSATAEGVAAPSRILPPSPGDDDVDGKPKPRLLQFGFNVRSNAVQTYAKQYRYKRVREITDAQRKNIKKIIVDATNKADPPAVIARKVRDVVGLTAYQAGIVQNYRAQLETMDPRAMTYGLRDKRFDAAFTKAIDAKKALSDAQVDKMVDAYQRRMIGHRAMTIARTEAIRAANNGHIKSVVGFLDDHPDWTVAKTWIATEDEKTRKDHRGLHRQTVIGLNTPFVCDSGEKIRWPHDPDAAAKEVINCFHPDTVIQGEVLLATRAAYSGPMREIVTRCGSVLTVTPHHPIATCEGFVDAVTLRKGDKLIRYTGGQNGLIVAALGNHKNDQPAKIQEIFDALRQKGCSTDVEVGSHDFHSDAEFIEGNVDVVWANRKLPIGGNIAISQGGDDLLLAVTNAQLPSMTSAARTLHFSEGPTPSASGGIGAGNLTSNTRGVGFYVSPLQSLRFGAASNLNIALAEAAGQNAPAEAALIRDLLQRYPAEILLDEVVEVRDFHYSGHVYDVQTTSKCVFAQDLLASNCRCTLMTTLIKRSDAARHGPAAYGTPTPNFWDGPKPAYDIDDPDDTFGNPTYEPA